MLDATAEALSNHLLTLLPSGRPHPRGDLNELPVPLAHYLGSVLDEQVDKKAAAPKSAWLDPDHELVQTAGKVWKTAARAGAQFPIRGWKKTVHSASRNMMGYLVEPIETVMLFAFRDTSTELESDVLLGRMASFSPYPYFREVAGGYVKRRTLVSIERSEFEKLLRRIDQRMVGSFRTSEWMTLLTPLFELVKTIPEYKKGVPADLLVRFFAAKDLDGIASRLDIGQVYDEERLREVLNSPTPLEPAPEETPPAVAYEAANDIVEENGSEPLWQRLAREKAVTREVGDDSDEYRIDTGNDNQVDDTETSEEPEDTVEVVNSDLREDDDEGAETVSGAEAAEAGETRMDETNTENADEEGPETIKTKENVAGEPLWRQLADSKSSGKAAATTMIANEPNDSAEGNLVREAPPETLRDLETRILGPSATERRDWYAQRLTGGSEAAYRTILEDLDQAKDWNEAWPILKDAYQTNKVEIYSDAIVAFTDAVEGCFRS